MIKRLLGIAVAALLFLPAQGTAGGPPLLCLPIDGVTAENARECSRLLEGPLAEKLWGQAGRDRGVHMLNRDGQWYAAFYMGGEVRLGEIEQPLKGSSFSVPRDRLRMFGHAILEIDPAGGKETALTGKFGEYVMVSQIKKEKDRRDVVVDMPYPIWRTRGVQGVLNWKDEYAWMDFNSTRTRLDTAIGAEKLPTVSEVETSLKKQDARLKDIRWNATWGCRALGAVALPVQDQSE